MPDGLVIRQNSLVIPRNSFVITPDSLVIKQNSFVITRGGKVSMPDGFQNG